MSGPVRTDIGLRRPWMLSLDTTPDPFYARYSAPFPPRFPIESTVRFDTSRGSDLGRGRRSVHSRFGGFARYRFRKLRRCRSSVDVFFYSVDVNREFPQ
jgi:hypothetical protein